jgi:hypothetical protein
MKKFHKFKCVNGNVAWIDLREVQSFFGYKDYKDHTSVSVGEMIYTLLIMPEQFINVLQGEMVKDVEWVELR